MEIFYSSDIEGSRVFLDQEESGHCVRVLRHREGDEVCIIDGHGTMMRCALVEASPKAAVAEILELVPHWGGHDYFLTMAVCPTKNMDRYEWFVEKAVELGVDRICPVIGDRSERKVLRTDRLRKILLSATKQSLKSRIPELDEPVKVRDFIEGVPVGQPSLRLIAHCMEDEGRRISIKSALDDFDGKDVVVLIGPEGDFSPEEISFAIDCGFIPVHLGTSRLRTETAAVASVSSVYLRYL